MELSRHGYLRKEDFLKDRLVFINTSAIETVYTPDIALQHMHIHDFVELSMVIEGGGIHCTLDGCKECVQGDVFVINSGTPHSFYRMEGREPLVVQNLIFDPTDIFEGEIGDPNHPRYCCGLFREDSMVSHIMLKAGYMDEAKSIMDRIEKEQERKWMEWQVAVRAHLLDFLIMCSRRISSRQIAPHTSALPKLKERQMAMTVMRSVLERCGDPELSLESIAKSVFLSKAHLSYIFKKVTGLRFSDYLRNVRLEQACRLLRETDWSNEKICHACGFRDLPSFYRFFRTYMSMTPNTYRKHITRV